MNGGDIGRRSGRAPRTVFHGQVLKKHRPWSLPSIDGQDQRRPASRQPQNDSTFSPPCVNVARGTDRPVSAGSIMAGNQYRAIRARWNSPQFFGVQASVVGGFCNETTLCHMGREINDGGQERLSPMLSGTGAAPRAGALGIHLAPVPHGFGDLTAIRQQYASAATRCSAPPPSSNHPPGARRRRESGPGNRRACPGSCLWPSTAR